MEIEILFCGVCHSDLHTARNEWAAWPTVYPCVPGHEIVGRVTKVGANVKGSSPATWRPSAAWSIRAARARAARKAWSSTATRRHGLHLQLARPARDRARHLRRLLREDRRQRAIRPARLADKLDLAAAAPLLCAGITLYSPLKHWGAGPGKKVGIVGLGGLGHMGVKFAHAFGAHTVLFTTSPSKIEDGKRLGRGRGRHLEERGRDGEARRAAST